MESVSLIQLMLQEEGAFFHPSIGVLPIHQMGGGHGVIATENLPSNTVIVKIPESSMITAQKARNHLNFWISQQKQERLGWTPFDGRSRRETSVDILGDLDQMLSPGSMIIFSLLVAAGQCGRFSNNAFHKKAGSASEVMFTVSTGGGNADLGPFFIHRWMRTWLLSLPTKYDNLLELLEHTHLDSTCVGVARSHDCEGGGACLRNFLCFERHRRKVLEERMQLEKEFNIVMSILSLHLPLVQPSGGCTMSCATPFTMQQFIWAYNTLMSRGFSYDPEVWAVIPWVDYFNHSLTNNATMRFDRCMGAYIFVTTAPVSKGDQVFLQYGSYTDAELVLWYGFITTPSLLPKFSSNDDIRSRMSLLRKVLLEHLRHEEVGNLGSERDAWLSSLNTALGHCFSPWAKADGSYPPSKKGASWLESLFTSYKDAVAGHKAFDVSGNVHTAVKAADELCRVLTRGTVVWDHRRLTEPGCTVGVWAPSNSMLSLLKYVSRVCRKFSPDTCLVPTAVLRAICWAELVCNGIVGEFDCPVDALLCPFGPKNEMVPLSEGHVGNMARQVSVDAAYLLYFLAVEATEDELRVYFLHDCV
ncbi:hypothetical protein, conserved [Trypanosoma brucei brucei TREU927]|uniref:SET domain-containing protein n=1 Tax=Trypanosoma brucei brucei (strain 927/4 GUTat10.1) TaxID=185431 RepID=Q57UB6_TRYB2|nr:hypothetical protein, conserved [Trypanosoma brucei brucei TREU927]AAX70803.1 hypothetical protein, conserved [Trypanosoma brucei]AAZ11461.1 hypothetical protein, conserved [Trypanosoma brucei brucei TREU927]